MCFFFVFMPCVIYSYTYIHFGHTRAGDRAGRDKTGAHQTQREHGIHIQAHNTNMAYTHTHTYTHTHAYIYANHIYIYIYMQVTGLEETKQVLITRSESMTDLHQVAQKGGQTLNGQPSVYVSNPDSITSGLAGAREVRGCVICMHVMCVCVCEVPC